MVLTRALTKVNSAKRMTIRQLMQWMMLVLIAWGACGTGIAAAATTAGPSESHELIRLRTALLPITGDNNPVAQAERQVIALFRAKFPWIEPVATTGLQLPGGQAMDMVPFMQIAGDIAPDLMYVNFRQSETYISMKLLYPLDQYIEAEAQVRSADSSALDNDHYRKLLESGTGWPALSKRLTEQTWEVMRRECPYGTSCPYREKWGQSPMAKHRHVFTFPVQPLVIAMTYNRGLTAEYARQGVQQRTPNNWEELIRWAKLMTNPPFEYGMAWATNVASWQFLSFLYSAGGEVVRQDAEGNWHCVIDTDQAAEAAWFYARLRLEKVVRGDRTYRGVVVNAENIDPSIRFAYAYTYLDSQFFSQAADLSLTGVGAVPAGPTGLRRSEFNARMVGVFSGLRDNPERRDAAWAYMWFYDGPEARKIRMESMVEAGLGRFVRPEILREFNTDGRYDDVLRQVPKELNETYRIAMQGGVPEPYGKNCQYIYFELNKPLGEIINNPDIIAAVDAGDKVKGKAIIRQILKRSEASIDQRLLGILPPKVEKQRQIVSWMVIAAVVLIFAWVFKRVYRTFRPPEGLEAGAWQFGKYRFAYILLLPAVLTIGMWMYWPLVKGTVIAFQDYSVLGESQWVGSAQFAEVLFSAEFWHSMWLSLLYALMYMFFGFWVPIALAFLLVEVPKGKTLFRTIYYLPAVLSGAVVIFLWRSFYNSDGLINQVINGPIVAINAIFGSNIQMVHQDWLTNPAAALICVLLPTIWVGMGPGCLIYLAALKTVPDEMYEAADLDGAGIWSKVFRIAIPSIKALVMINFIGAMIGAVRGSSAFVLAMTGGGPYNEAGGATEVIGLHIFYVTFGYLKFGTGAAMAWVLGAMLIGFTVVQLQRLSQLEFKTAKT